MLAKNGDIIKIHDDWETYGMLSGEIYVVGFKNDKLVALPKYRKESIGLDIDDDGDYEIIGNIKDNKNLIPSEYTKKEISKIIKDIE